MLGAQGRLSEFELRLKEEIPLKERELRQGLIWSEQDVTSARGQFQQSLLVPEDLEAFLTENRHLMRDETVTAVEEARLQTRQTGSRFETEAGKMLEMRGKRGLVEDWELPLFTQRFAEMFQVEGLPQATKVAELRTRQVDLRHMIERFNQLDERIGTLTGVGAPSDAQRAELAQLQRQRQTLTDDGFTTRRAQDLHDQLEDQVREFQAEDVGRPDQKARRKRGRGEVWEIYEARVSDMDVADMEDKQNRLLSRRADILKEVSTLEADAWATRDPAKAAQYLDQVNSLNVEERELAQTIAAGESDIGDARKANMTLNEKAVEASRINAEDEAYRHQARRRRLSWDGRAATRLTQTLTGLVGLTVLLAGVTMGLQMGIQMLAEKYMKFREQNRQAASGIRQTTTAMSLQNFESSKALAYATDLNDQLDREMRIRLGMATPATQRGVAAATDQRMVSGARLRFAAENVFAEDRGGLNDEVRAQIDDMVLAWEARNWDAFKQYLEPKGILQSVEPSWLGKVESEYMKDEERWRILDEMASDLFARMSVDMGEKEAKKLEESIDDIRNKGYDSIEKEWEKALTKPSWFRAPGVAMGIGMPDRMTEILENRDRRNAEAITEELDKVMRGDKPVYALKEALGKFDYAEMTALPVDQRSEEVKDLIRNVSAWQRAMIAEETDPSSKMKLADSTRLLEEHLPVGIVPRHEGGTVDEGEVSLVGEEGPEIVQLPGGSQVFPTGTGPMPDLVEYKRQMGDLGRITDIGYHGMHDSQIKYLTDTERQWLSFWHGMDRSAYEGWSDQQRVADQQGPTLAGRVKKFFTDLFSNLLPDFELPWSENDKFETPEIDSSKSVMPGWLSPSWVPWSFPWSTPAIDSSGSVLPGEFGLDYHPWEG